MFHRPTFQRLTSRSTRGRSASSRRTNSNRSGAMRSGAIFCAVVVALGLTACSSSDEDAGHKVASVDDVDSATTVQTDGSDGDGVESGDGVEDPQQSWEDCMAEQGVEMPVFDEVSGNEVEEGTIADDSIEFDEDFEAAAKACSEELGDAELSDATDGMTADQRAAFNNYNLELEKCYAENGYDLPNGTSNDPEAQRELDEIFLSWTPEEFQEFEEVSQRCETSTPIPQELQNFGTEPPQ